MPAAAQDILAALEAGELALLVADAFDGRVFQGLGVEAHRFDGDPGHRGAGLEAFGPGPHVADAAFEERRPPASVAVRQAGCSRRMRGTMAHRCAIMVASAPASFAGIASSRVQSLYFKRSPSRVSVLLAWSAL